MMAKRKLRIPRYSEKRGWFGGSKHTLYTFRDNLTGSITVSPMPNYSIGPNVSVRVSTRAEAEAQWQNPLHPGWNTLGAISRRGNIGVSKLRDLGDLGLPPEPHARGAQSSFKSTKMRLDKVQRAAARNNCQGVWDNLMIARANLSDGFAHLSSIDHLDGVSEARVKVLSDTHLRLANRLTRMQESFGFQCTRKINRG
jgi:hypothetical protein